MGPSQIPAALKGKPNPPKIVRPRKLQTALDTIRLYGGYLGVTDAATELGVQASNLDWHIVSDVGRISCGRMYLRWDVEAAKARREGKS
jgi:hypothetical protein